MFFEAKCAEEKSVLRSKMFFEAKGAEEQSVLRSNIYFFIHLVSIIPEDSDGAKQGFVGRKNKPDQYSICFN